MDADMRSDRFDFPEITSRARSWHDAGKSEKGISFLTSSAARRRIEKKSARKLSNEEAI